ncbi:insulinase family protein [Alsobacter sp. SYSU M60028]|uniref:Insulinase family protein n=1 Tax=Alsobacter ponti TaxID=2962936 RepID=A0ABT1LCG9_9HYPH|nr:pitrilysin family protein [Alsobacter ponti]MCP8939192.1 insulinase family protein [Alsobacter ponti]
MASKGSPSPARDAAPLEADAHSGPAVSDFRLANGLEVVVIPDHRTPVVTHMVWYRNGSADDPIGKSGIAHFLEHLMFKGTEKHPQGEFSNVVAELGGQENAFTSVDYTAYYQRVAKEHLETVMGFEADRMQGLVLSDEVVGPERDVVIEERRMRTDTDPGSQLGEAVAATLFTHHPYGKPIIGWMHEIEGLNREDALAYYRRFYTPANAILVVAGDVTPDEVRALAEKTYGQVAAAAEPPRRNRPQEPDPRAARRVSLADPKVEQPSLQRAWLAPSYTTGAPGEAEALEVLVQVLGAQSTGRLHRRLVMEKRVAVAAGGWYQGTAVDRTRLMLYAVPRPGVTLEDLEKDLEAVIAELVEKGVEPSELARAKTRLIADTVYAQDSQATLARIYGSTLATGGAVADVARWPRDIEAVTAQDVQNAAARWLDRRHCVTGYLLKDEDGARAA